MKRLLGWPRSVCLAVAVIVPSLAAAQSPLSSAEVANVEKTMAQWLSHPLEFGAAPRRVHYLRSVPVKLAGQPEPVVLHLVEYLMPNGAYGRGFVNPTAWSFLGPVAYDKLTDLEVVTAYLGWLWHFSAIQEGRALAAFDPQTLKPLITELNRDGVSGVVVTEQAKVGSLEFFAFTGVRDGKAVKGAGSSSSKLVLDAGSPIASLPVLYSYLGMLMQEKI